MNGIEYYEHILVCKRRKWQCLRSQQRVGRWDPGSFLSKLKLGPGGVVGDGGEGGGVLVAQQGQVLREGRGARVGFHKGSNRTRRSWNCIMSLYPLTLISG